MQDESLHMVPRADRPSPEELEDYKPRFTEGEYDYDELRPQLGAWLYDYRRKQEEERGRADGRVPFEENELLAGGRTGYDPTHFDALTSGMRVSSKPSL